MLGVVFEVKGLLVKVYYFNCGIMNVFGIVLLCYVLFVEIDDGLVLVDIGFGIQDCFDFGWVGLFCYVLWLVFLQVEIVVCQIEQFGYCMFDV